MDQYKQTTQEYSEAVNGSPVNGSGKKRIAMFLAGSSAVAYGLSRRGWVPRALAATGGYFVYRSLSSKEPVQSYVLVSQTINKPIEEVYSFMRESRNWPRLDRTVPPTIRASDDPETKQEELRRMEMIDELENRNLRWRCEGPETEYEVSAQFATAPGKRGTEVWIFAECTAPTSPVQRVLKTAAGMSMEQNAREHLRHCKQMLEAGEIPTTEGQPTGRRGISGKVKRAVYRENPVESKRPSRATGQTPNDQTAAS